MEPVAVFGANGYTGRLVAGALARSGRPWFAVGRNVQQLTELAEQVGHCQDVRRIDLAEPGSLTSAMDGCGAVANTIGPFVRYGLPVVEAAISTGTHYVDTTAEQSFQKAAYEQFDRRAKDADVTVITGQAVDFAFAYCGARILEDRFGPLTAVDSYHWLDDYKTSRGTAISALGMVSEDFYEYRDGTYGPLPAPLRPDKVTFSGERHVRRSVPFPGGDAILLPAEIATLQSVTNNLVLPAGQAWGFAAFSALKPVFRRIMTNRLVHWLEDRISRTMPDPDEATRSAARWTVVVRGTGESGDIHDLTISGPDVYDTTGEVAALGACWLADGRGRQTGVCTTGATLEPVPFLDALKFRGLEWHIH